MTKLSETLQMHFGKDNIHSLEKYENVFLCEKKSATNKTYQIIFVDTSNNWLNEDYSKYLETVVIDKYYQTEGFLQWNFYYYIIASAEKIKEFKQRKKDIESDNTYTRKAVLTEEEFSEWIDSFNNISEISKEAISNDLYTNWVNYLRERKLFFVFNSDEYPNYKQPVEDYINGLPSDDTEDNEQNESSGTMEAVLQRITNLKLNEFREYPLIRDFDLGSVNLLHGANAVGKTSFFDAIELTVTGKLLSKTTNDSYKIEFQTNTNDVFKFPVRPSPYRKRDIDWYNSGSNRGNDLNGHFNKFNFYTSDAAFQLKQDDTNSQNNLQETIADIALGREVNKLELRIKAFADKFSDWANQFLNEATRLSESLREKNEIITDLSKQQKNPQVYKQAVIEATKNSQWKSTFGEGDEAIVKLDNEIQNVSSNLSIIQSKSIIDIQTLTMENIELEIKELEIKKLAISNLRNEILKYQQDRQTYIKELERNKSIMPIMDELSSYFRHRHFNSLVGLEKKIKSKTIEQNRAKEIKQLADSILENIFLDPDSTNTKSVKQIEVEITTQNESLKKNHSEMELKVKQLESGIEELSIVISDIKSLGLSYLKINPNAEDCPLCNTHFANDELVTAIRKTQDSFSNSIALTSLKEELESMSKKLDEIEKQLEVITQLKRLSLLLFSENGYEKTVTEIREGNQINTKTLLSLTEALIQLNTLQSEFNNEGLSEEKYFYLENRLAEALSLKVKSISELEIQMHSLQDKQNNLQSANTQIGKEMGEKESSLNAIFNSEIQNEEQLIRRINVLQEILNCFKQIEIYLEFPPTDLLATIIEKVNHLSSVFETYKKAAYEAMQHGQVIEITNKEIERIKAEIDLLTPKQIQAQFAKDELNKLLIEQSKNTFLSDYIGKNRNEIVSIFKIIHTPREFKNINFTNGKITLTSIDDNERTLSEISTGQRSALALSIFLSLNKKLSKGPNILMFDDPVTYVDDMNVLSFFDYLRELVIKSNRQVFFATANDDLAFLFRKKFEFLEDDLKVFKLERMIEATV
jgi:exonuclease SbcC